MTLMELYNLKLNEYKETSKRDKPSKLLAMLLLSEKEKFEPLKDTQGEFYKKYKKEIDEKICKVERDFNIVYEDIINYIKERNVACNNYEQQRIWFVYEEGFGVLNWALLYYPNLSAEEIYSKYFNSNELNESYDLEQIQISKNIQYTPLEYLLKRIIDEPSDFYRKISNALTQEEKKFILNILENKTCITCLNENCNKLDSKKIDVCEEWYNEEIIGKSKILKRVNINKLI